MRCFDSKFDSVEHWKINWNEGGKQQVIYQHLMGLNPKQCSIHVYNVKWDFEDVEKMYHFLGVGYNEWIKRNKKKNNNIDDIEDIDDIDDTGNIDNINEDNMDNIDVDYIDADNNEINISSQLLQHIKKNVLPVDKYSVSAIEKFISSRFIILNDEKYIFFFLFFFLLRVNKNRS